MHKKIVAISVLTASMLFSTAVLALPLFAWSQTYYSDASLTNEVGGRSADCSGNVHVWGQITQFRGPKVVEEICPASAE